MDSVFFLLAHCRRNTVVAGGEDRDFTAAIVAAAVQTDTGAKQNLPSTKPNVSAFAAQKSWLLPCNIIE